MSINGHKLSTVLLWGTGMFALQSFLSNPNNRAQILISILLSYLIYSANQLIMTNKMYQKKILSIMLPLFIMNGILVPLNLIVAYINGFSFSDLSMRQVTAYLLFNLFVLMVYFLQRQYYKNQINNRLKAKVKSLT